MALTDAQLNKLTANKRKVLPSYYSSIEGASLPIPSATEDALILMSSATKKKAVDYLKQLTAAEPTKRTQDYNALLEEVTAQQVQYSEATSAELLVVTGKFNTFLTGFSGSLDGASLSVQAGMEPVLSAMTRSMGRLVDIERNEKFHRMFNGYMEGQHKKAEQFEVKKELRSWIRAFVSYP